jgi:hypothetical protein
MSPVHIDFKRSRDRHGYLAMAFEAGDLVTNALGGDDSAHIANIEIIDDNTWRWIGESMSRWPAAVAVVVSVMPFSRYLENSNKFVAPGHGVFPIFCVFPDVIGWATSTSFNVIERHVNK